jgi:hypothetical protein
VRINRRFYKKAEDWHRVNLKGKGVMEHELLEDVESFVRFGCGPSLQMRSIVEAGKVDLTS